MFKRILRNINFIKRHSSNLPSVIKSTNLPFERSLLGTHKVTVLNGDTETGRYTCFNLKQNRHIKELRIYVHSNSEELAKDLRFIPGTAKFSMHSGPPQMEKALKDADIVLVLPKYVNNSIESKQKIFMKNKSFLRETAIHCMDVCPQAIIAIDVPPLNSSVPFFSNMLSQQSAFDTTKVFGNMNMQCLRVQTFLARKFSLHPETLGDVCVIGGGTSETMVPLLSKFQPGGFPLFKNPRRTIQEIKKLEWVDNDVFGIHESAYLRSRGLSKLVSQISLGLQGKTVKGCAFIRTSDPVASKYFCLPVEFGKSGIERNLGLPNLSTYEAEALYQSMPIIEKEISIGEKFVPESIPWPVVDERILEKAFHLPEEIVSPCMT